MAVTAENIYMFIYSLIWCLYLTLHVNCIKKETLDTLFIHLYIPSF